jgi:hypothetical protein
MPRVSLGNDFFIWHQQLQEPTPRLAASLSYVVNHLSSIEQRR